MSSQTSNYNTSKDWPMNLPFKCAAPSLIQAEMGGMQGDQRMLRWLALHSEDRNSVGNPDEPLVPQTDPLDIYCDQHQDGRLVCLLQGGPYSKMLSEAFRAVSGFNTRRQSIERRTRHQQMVFDALRYSSKLLRGLAAGMPAKSGPEMEYELPLGAIAGMVGTLEITHARSKYFVTVSARDIRKFIVIPKPTRDNRRGLQDITPECRDAILEKAKSKTIRRQTCLQSNRRRFQRQDDSLSRFWLVAGRSRPWVDQRKRVYRLTKAPDWS